MTERAEGWGLTISATKTKNIPSGDHQHPVDVFISNKAETMETAVEEGISSAIHTCVEGKDVSISYNKAETVDTAVEEGISSAIHTCVEGEQSPRVLRVNNLLVC